ncbi:hypothetical protein [Streptomyces sp. ISL-1]|uniref:DUF6907 domain-containing protein n=1 Tax=Streptomyces sp. ISL-1 TaxID=2817657 RepID=UPI0027E4CE2A|nr:hypothetical protein [Streptomyces sp. ISL-1]
MSALRTITVPTLDYGPVTMPEPAWCVSDHQPAGYRNDTIHSGPEVTHDFDGHELFTASLVGYPYSASGGPRLGVSVDLGSIGQTLDPTELDRLAAAFVESAVRLRALARELTALKAGGDR